jgi:Ca-activated chloride channel family protein
MRSQGPLVASVIAAIALSIYFSAVTHTEAQEPSSPSNSRPATHRTDNQSPQIRDSLNKEADRQQEPGRESIRIDTNMVQLDVMVINKNNIPVFNLTKNDFTVYDEKSPQVIESVTLEEVPVSIGLVIDTSESMRYKLKTIADGAFNLIKQMRQEDEAFVAQFKTRPDLVQEFTSDKGTLESALRSLQPSGGTSLLDAVIATAKFAQDYAKQRRKALIVITDGLERNSSNREKEVIESIRENEVQLYLIGFLEDDDEPSTFFYKTPIRKGKELLTRLAGESGGRAFFPQDVIEMPAIALQIATELRTQYIVSYYPNNEKQSGIFHKVQVVVNQKNKRDKLIARTRQGYYPRPEKGAVPR